MDALTVIEILNALATLSAKIVPLAQAAQATASATDAAAIAAALASAQAAAGVDLSTALTDLDQAAKS